MTGTPKTITAEDMHYAALMAMGNHDHAREKIYRSAAHTIREKDAEIRQIQDAYDDLADRLPHDIDGKPIIPGRDPVWCVGERWLIPEKNRVDHRQPDYMKPELAGYAPVRITGTQCSPSLTTLVWGEGKGWRPLCSGVVSISGWTGTFHSSRKSAQIEADALNAAGGYPQ
jgi:hypothetical protein